MNPDLELMPFQETASTAMAGIEHALIVWEPGCGKTPAAVRACLKASAHQILVFCPPIAINVWETHFRDWSTIRDIRVMNSGHNAFSFVHGYGVRIVPYSRAKPGTEAMFALRSINWDAVILDEGHYLKTSSAQRTRAIYGDLTDLTLTPLQKAKHVWVLTGTPILNHPGEFWTHLRALAPQVLYVSPTYPVMEEDYFVRRFCVVRPTPYGHRIMGSRNSSELARRVKPVIDRKRIKDVLPEMPDVRIVEHPLPADTDLGAQLRQEMVATFGADQIKDMESLDDEQLLASFQATGQFSTVRRLIGRVKAKPSAELISDMLDDALDEKLIVFCHHREVIRDLADHLKRHTPLVIHGGTPHAVRNTSINLFQNDPKFRLIVLAIDTAGEVITLTASHNVILIEPSPVPMRNVQAIGRARRRGQKHPVLARFVLMPGTLDARLMSIIARKTKDIDRVIDPDLVTSVPEPTVQDEARLAFPD